MRPEHRLRAPGVRVAGNHSGGIAGGQIEQGPHQTRQQRAHAVALAAQPQAQIERNLLIAAAASVDFIRDGARMLLQLADDQRVHILIGGAREELRLGGFFANLIEGFHDAGALIRG